MITCGMVDAGRRAFASPADRRLAATASPRRLPRASGLRTPAPAGALRAAGARPRPRDGRPRTHPPPQGRPLRRGRDAQPVRGRGAAGAGPAHPAARDPQGGRRAEGRVPAAQPAPDRHHLRAPLRSPGQPPHRQAGARRRAVAAPSAAAALPLPRHRRPGAAPEGDRRPLPGRLERHQHRRLPGDDADAGLRDAGPLGGGGLAGSGGPPPGPRHPARKVDLKAMAAIRRLQANPELGEFRIHAALAQLGIDLSPRTCGRILALHRALGAPQPAAATPREAQPMPFAAQRRHQFWSVDVRYIEDHQLGTGKPAYVISILENFSRAILASAISPAARPDRLPHRPAGSDRGARGARGLGERRRGRLSREPRESDLRGARDRETRDRPGAGVAELRRDPFQRHAPDGRLPLRPSHDLGGVAGGPRPLLPRLQPPAARRPRRPPQGAAQSRRGAGLGARAPGAIRPISTASSACGRRGCSRRAAACGSGTGGCTASGASPASVPGSGWMGRR